MRIPLASYGFREIGAGMLLGCITAVCLYVIHPVLTFIPAAAATGLLLFFRDPFRLIKRTARGEILSPADGRVADITELEAAPYLRCRCLRIGIFMSVFNVHVNRAPVTGTVTFVEHFPGGHHDARNVRSQSENEHNFIGIVDPDGGRYLVNQIAGFAARRIVCAVREGDHLEVGEKIGMIKFGSRLEVYVPLEYGPVTDVCVGDCVKAGIDTLAHLAVDLTNAR